MHPIHYFSPLITLLLRQTSACMHYSATFPYATHLPFEATLTDNSVVTCWISMTYDQHDKQQTAFSNHRRARTKPLPQKQQEQQKQISLTSELVRNNRTKDGKTGNLKKDLRKSVGQERGEEGEEKVKGIWLPWEFKCLEGYQAHAGIGLRAVWYSAHGQEFEFAPKCEEDVLGERWVYGVDLWC
jgi:hypothetical protein